MGTRHTKYGWWKDQQGKVINAETLTVYLTGTTDVATIYAASSGGSAITNGAITLSSVGFFQYWVDEDDYATTQWFKHVFTGSKFQTTTTDPVIIFPGITASSTDTLTNKTIDADNNTISNLAHGAEVDNPSSGVHGVTGSVVGTTDTQTLSAKTLTTPTIGSMTNAQHDHADAAGGGNLGAVAATSIAATSNVTVDSNFLLEGYTTGRSVFRAIRMRLEPGATPGTNINVTILGSANGGYNIPTITDATDLAKSGSSGSFGLDAAGKLLTMDITENIVAIISADVATHNLNNSSTVAGDIWFPDLVIVSNNMVFSLVQIGGDVDEDLTGILQAGDRCDILISFITST